MFQRMIKVITFHGGSVTHNDRYIVGAKLFEAVAWNNCVALAEVCVQEHIFSSKMRVQKSFEFGGKDKVINEIIRVDVKYTWPRIMRTTEWINTTSSQKVKIHICVSSKPKAIRTLRSQMNKDHKMVAGKNSDLDEQC